MLPRSDWDPHFHHSFLSYPGGIILSGERWESGFCGLHMLNDYISFYLGFSSLSGFVAMTLLRDIWTEARTEMNTLHIVNNVAIDAERAENHLPIATNINRNMDRLDDNKTYEPSHFLDAWEMVEIIKRICPSTKSLVHEFDRSAKVVTMPDFLNPECADLVTDTVFWFKATPKLNFQVAAASILKVPIDRRDGHHIGYMFRNFICIRMDSMQQADNVPVTFGQFKDAMREEGCTTIILFGPVDSEKCAAAVVNCYEEHDPDQLTRIFNAIHEYRSKVNEQSTEAFVADVVTEALTLPLALNPQNSEANAQFISVSVPTTSVTPVIFPQSTPASKSTSNRSSKRQRQKLRRGSNRDQTITNRYPESATTAVKKPESTHPLATNSPFVQPLSTTHWPFLPFPSGFEMARPQRSEMEVDQGDLTDTNTTHQHRNSGAMMDIEGSRENEINHLKLSQRQKRNIKRKSKKTESVNNATANNGATLTATTANTTTTTTTTFNQAPSTQVIRSDTVKAVYIPPRTHGSNRTMPGFNTNGIPFLVARAHSGAGQFGDTGTTSEMEIELDAAEWSMDPATAYTQTQILNSNINSNRSRNRNDVRGKHYNNNTINSNGTLGNEMQLESQPHTLEAVKAVGKYSVGGKRNNTKHANHKQIIDHTKTTNNNGNNRNTKGKTTQQPLNPPAYKSLYVYHDPNDLTAHFMEVDESQNNTQSVANAQVQVDQLRPLNARSDAFGFPTSNPYAALTATMKKDEQSLAPVKIATKPRAIRFELPATTAKATTAKTTTAKATTAKAAVSAVTAAVAAVTAAATTAATTAVTAAVTAKTVSAAATATTTIPTTNTATVLVRRSLRLATAAAIATAATTATTATTATIAATAATTATTATIAATAAPNQAHGIVKDITHRGDFYDDESDDEESQREIPIAIANATPAVIHPINTPANKVTVTRAERNINRNDKENNELTIIQQQQQAAQQQRMRKDQQKQQDQLQQQRNQQQKHQSQLENFIHQNPEYLNRPFEIPPVEQVANHGNLMKIVPKSVLAIVHAAQKKQLMKVNEALDAKDDEAFAREYAKFSLITQVLLCSPNRGKTQNFKLEATYTREAHIRLNQLRHDENLFFNSYLLDKYGAPISIPKLNNTSGSKSNSNQGVNNISNNHNGLGTTIEEEIEAARSIAIPPNSNDDEQEQSHDNYNDDSDDEVNLPVDNNKDYILLRKSRTALDEEISSTNSDPTQPVVHAYGGRDTLCNEISYSTKDNGDIHVVPPIEYGTSTSNTTTTQTETLNNNARKAATHIRNGQIHRGMNALTSAGMAIPLSAEDPIVTQLQNLNPSSYNANPTPNRSNPSESTNYIFSRALLPEAVPIVVDITALKQSFLDVNNGSSPGLTGFTGEMGALIANDNDCMVVMHKIATRVFANDIPTVVSEYMRASLQLAAYKGDNHNGKVRPLAVGEVIPKAFDDYITKLVALPISIHTLQPSQMAIGVAGGSEVAIHSMNILLETGSGPEIAFEDKPAIMKLDMANAYSTLSRAAFFHAIRSDPDANKVAAYASFLYGTPSKLIVRLKNGEVSVIRSEEGVHQGRKSSGVIYCLPVSIGLNGILKKYPRVSAVCIMDDTHLIGPLSQLLPVFEEFKLFIESELQMSFNLKKCHVLWAHSLAMYAPPLLRDIVKKHDFTLDIGVMETLGGAVGMSFQVPKAMVVETSVSNRVEYEITQNDVIIKVDETFYTELAQSEGSDTVTNTNTTDNMQPESVDGNEQSNISNSNGQARDQESNAVEETVDPSGISGLSFEKMKFDEGSAIAVYDGRHKAVEKMFVGMEKIFQAILHPKITHHMFLTVMRQSIATQTNYAMRTNSPTFLYGPMKQYNEALLTNMGQKMGVPSFSLLERAQLSFRVSQSGFGLRCLSDAQLPIAYVSSFIQAIPPQYDRLMAYNNNHDGHIPDCAKHFMHCVRWIRENVFRSTTDAEKRQAEIDELLPATFAECLVKFRYSGGKHLQHVLTKSFEDHLFAAIMHDTETTQADRARLLDLTSRFASTWLTVTPSRRDLELADNHCDVSFRQRIGRDAVDHCCLSCPRCGFLYALDTWHPLWCHLNKMHGMTDRHNEARDKIVDMCKSYGMQARSEPNVYGDGDTNPGARPDLLVHLNDKTIVGDLTFRYVGAPSNLENGNATVPGRVIQYAESSKTSKHAQRAAIAGYSFYPMAVSTNGAIGPQLIRMFMEISEEEAESVSHSSFTTAALSCSKASHDYNVNLQLQLSAQQCPIAIGTVPSPDPGPDPGPSLVHDQVQAQQEDRLAKVAAAMAAAAVDKLSPEPSMFWELVRTLAMSTQRTNSRMVISDLKTARIAARDRNHMRVVPHL